MLIFLIIGSFLQAESFTLSSDTLKGQISKAQEFNGFGCNGENIIGTMHQRAQRVLPLRSMIQMHLLEADGGIG